jgi:hypothetical protein
MRHEPNGSRESVAQSFGIEQPDSPAARMIDVPAGTETGEPSMVKVTVTSEVDFGVPKSGSPMPSRIGDRPRGSDNKVMFNS